MFFYIFSCLLPECRFEWGVGGNQKNDHARGSAGLRVRSEWTRVRACEFWSQSYEALFCSFAFSLGDLQHKSWRKVRLFWKNTLTWCVTTIFLDWKPIASSRDPSYIDYFGLDQSQGGFEGKTPEIERLTGKISSSTDGYSRQERIHPWSPQTLNTWPRTQPRRWDNTKNMCKELLCGPGGPIMTTISWWGGVEESPMRRWRRWWRRTSPWKRLVLSIEVEELTPKRRHNFKHQTICLEPFVHHFPTAGAPHCDGDGDGVRTSEACHDCCRDLFCPGGDLVHTCCIFVSGFYLLHVWIMRRPRFWTSPTSSATTGQTSLVQVI